MGPTNIWCLDGGDIGGWIAPEGLFFQAHYCEHDEVAQWIVDEWLGVVSGGYYSSTYLVQRGWIRLETSGDIFHDFHPTTQQAEVLYWCYTRGSEYYQGSLYPSIASIVLGATCVRESLPLVPRQGEQENVNVRRVLAGRGVGLYW